MTRSAPPAENAADETWTIESARTLYNIEGWGIGYFDISERGHVVVRPDIDNPTRELDLYELANDLEAQGVGLPMLLRFSDILRSRIESLNARFDAPAGLHITVFEELQTPEVRSQLPGFGSGRLD